jgi:fused signal recognition particle receptor
MEMLVALLLVALLLVGSVAGVALSRRRSRAVELEPPPSPEPTEATTAVEAAPDQAPAATAGPTKEELERELELDPSLVQQLEEALAEAEPLPEAPPTPEPVPEVEAPPEPEVVAPPVRPRFRDRLTKARSLLAGYVSSVLSRSAIDEDTWEELEEALVRTDVGVGLTTSLLDDLRTRVKAERITTPDALLEALKSSLKAMLSDGDRTLRAEQGVPNVWLFVGVNGVGKTTTIGKIGRQASAQGLGVVMAAADTFRAAAAEQLELWAKRVDADLVRGAEGADPGSVVFDAVERAAAKGAELVLADTAGRLHTKVNLMEELKKVRRVAERPPGRLQEVLLVIDATTGQNGLVQASQFTEAVGVTGIVLTKLDGTAKGGIVIAIQTQLGIPIKLVGLGESPDDIADFDPEEFVEALFS